MRNRFIKINGTDLPYSNNFFNICIADSCLDSMHFMVAKKIIKEIGRVTKNYIYLSLIGENTKTFIQNKYKESIVKSDHELGTIQSYFNLKKINELVKEIDFKIISLYKQIENDEINNITNSRFFIVLENK